MRYLVFALLLIASHGLVIWAGVATRAQVKAPAISSTSPQAARGGKIELSQFMGPKEEKAPPERPAGPSWTERYNSALKAIPADADVAALVKAGTAEQEAIISPETCAAFALWVERDAEAAMRWHTAWYAANGVSTFNNGIHRYLESHPVGDLDRLLLSVPEARNELLGAAVLLSKKEGADVIAKLATSLSNGGDRMWVLTAGLKSVDGLGPHLAVIRNGLDERGMRELLQHVGELEHAGDLLESIKAAGFSEDAVRNFEKAVAESAEARQKQSMGAADLLRSGGLANKDAASRLDQKLAQELPDFTGWCRDFADARLSADEVMSRLKDGIPNSAGSESAMREYLFRKLYPMNPQAAIDWLREGRSDWQGLVKQVSGDLPSEVSLEELHKLAESMSPQESQASGIEYCLTTRYGWWYERDPQHCRAAVERMPEGGFKEKLRAKLKQEDEKEARMR